MPAGFKNSRKLWTNGQDPNIPVRLLNLENNEYKVTYYEIISGASGSLTLPTGATINAGEFGLSGNCILSKIDGSNKPTFESPKTSGGVVVTSSLNVSNGAWVASGTYTDINVALIYSVKIKAVNYSNLDYDFIIETIEIDKGVQSVTGPQVDDTDPLNPIVNPLGKIRIVDLNGEFFTDLATASAYVATFNVAGIISDESYNNGVYYFTVPQGSDFSGADYFLSLNTISTTSAYIVDENNLISILGDYAFKNNSGNNIVSSPMFGIEAFALASGINVITDSVPAFGDDAFNSFGGVVTFYGSIANSSGNYFGQGATGKFIILGKGSPLSCYATLFMTGATSTILVDKYYYTNNAGDIDACLASAITEGCNVQFDGINLATIPNLALKAPIASPTFTGTVTTPSIIVSSETASRVAIIDASKNVKSADTATYPSLAELAYIKGLTSAIQTQLDDKRYTIPFNSINFNPADATTYYFGGFFSAAPVTTPAVRQITVPKTGTITEVSFNSASTALGSAGSMTISIRVNNTTDYLVTNAFDISSAAYLTVSGLSIPISANDLIEFKLLTPTWATNPTVLYFTGNILVK